MIMAEWFDDDSFWETFRDFMFSPARIDAARDEVDRMVESLALKPGAQVLDLCCGVGRHSLEFARRGFKVTGVDRTTRYLDHARELAAKENLQIEFIQSDARSFSRREAFDGAISMFTSFGYFADANDDLQVARNVCESLRPGGCFIIDMNGKEGLAAKFRERDWNRMGDAILMEERRLLDGWSKIETRWIFLKGTERKESTLLLRLYSGTELKTLLKEAGFSSAQVYGSLAATPYDHRADRLVAVGTK
jgi:SAM-dependent methyltransferase